MVVFVHRNFWGDRRAVGKSMIVGRMIFNIVVGLSCVSGLSREFVWRLPILLGLYLLHRLRMQV